MKRPRKTTKKPNYRYSWKKPWAFETYLHMRHQLTEREVYKKIGLIERHSRFKHPNWHWKHPVNELFYQGAGWKGRPPDGYPGPPTPGVGFEVCPDHACNGGGLECDKANCDTITCICGKPPYFAYIEDDPTGLATIEGNGTFTPKVCVPDLSDWKPPSDYPVITVKVLDSEGKKEIFTEHPLINCSGCCDTFTIVADQETVNIDGAATFTISPACEGATAEAQALPDESDSIISNADVVINGAGSQVTVTPRAGDCGSFRVAVTDAGEGCGTTFYSNYVRIADAGSWQLPATGYCYAANYFTSCASPDTCLEVVVGEYRYQTRMRCCTEGFSGVPACCEAEHTTCECSSCPAGAYVECHRTYCEKQYWGCS